MPAAVSFFSHPPRSISEQPRRTLSTNANAESNESNLLGRVIHSFIVKIWKEDESQKSTWRGHITHVSGNEKKYLTSLDDIPCFIKPYIERMGVRVKSGWQLSKWWKQL